MSKKVLLVILDGWGHGEVSDSSAIAMAQTPYMDSLYENYPNAELVTYGEQVGLPEGQMGNSEVGHLNIGAGRIVYQELARINNEIATGNLSNNSILNSLLTETKENNKTLHFIGLLSDGGVHSHINHLKALIEIAEDSGIQNIFIHAFLDGRDTRPENGKEYIKELLEFIKGKQTKLSSIVGRYYAMDRDKRWERIKKAYDLMVKGKAEQRTDDPVNTISEYYKKGITDEFMESIIVNQNESQLIKDDDVVLCFNYRTDRPRQITEALTQSDFPEHSMKKLDISFVGLTKYDNQFKNVGVLFEKEDIKQTLGETLAHKGMKQVRIAETEKYPHVTFFFSGGKEQEFSNESRILVNSPKVATYDLQPEMSAYELTNAISKSIDNDIPDFIVINFANADMVGHTGNFQAAKLAAEVLDNCMECLVPYAIKSDYRVIVIADHGNSDYMINEDGSPHTAHTMNPVPIIVIDKDKAIKKVKNGKLADIAPTILKLMEIDIPSEMTGNILTE